MYKLTILVTKSKQINIIVGRRLDERSGQLSMKGQLRQGHYDVKVTVYDVIWKHEVVSTVTVVVKEIDDVVIANAGSLRIRGDVMIRTSSFHCLPIC